MSRGGGKVLLVHGDPQVRNALARLLRGEAYRPVVAASGEEALALAQDDEFRVVITELKGGTYFARLILQQQNELGRKIVEIDARPSDCLALATAHRRPIFVSTSLFGQVEDMSELLERINENSGETES